MKIGAVIIATGTDIPKEEIKKLLICEKPNLFERIVQNYHRAGIKDIVVVVSEQSEEIEQTLLHKGITFLNSEFEQTGYAAAVGIRYLKQQCDSLIISTIEYPFFLPETIRKLTCYQANIIKIVGKCENPGVMSVNAQGAEEFCIKVEETEPCRLEDLDLECAKIDVEDDGVQVKIRTAEEYEEQRKYFEKGRIRGDVKVRLSVNRSFFGPGTATLLTQIERLGSVREACVRTGMSYSKGWKLIHLAEEETGWKLVERMPGGKNGGQAYVTEKGKYLLEKFACYEKRVEEASQKIYKDIFLDDELF